MNLEHLRNIGIIAHIDAGKTTFSERILFYSDVIHRMGEVHEGAATMDFMPEEQERGITIASACVTCLWNGCTINLVDTPGHVDFTIEVERSLRVLDGAVGIFDAVAGVEPQSETVWRQADNFDIPRLAVVNKMDRPGASFAGTLQSMRERLGIHPVPVTVPLGEGEEFAGVLDVIGQERLLFDRAEKGRLIERVPLTREEQALVAPWREALLDALTEADDELLERCLAGEEIPEIMLHAALRRAVLEQRLVPVFAASALRNIGVQPVLDAVCLFLPSPLDRRPEIAYPADVRAPKGGGADIREGTGAAEVLEVAGVAETPATDAATFAGAVSPADAAGESGTRAGGVPVLPDPNAPVCALVFKVLMSGGRKVAFVRIYSGTIKEGDALRNTRRGVTERAARIYRLLASRREQLPSASAGDIVAIQGCKRIFTGDTLVGGGGGDLLLEDIRALKPVISLAFEPKNAEESARLDEALEYLSVEDPTIQVAVDEATGQRIVSGMGELHLDVLAERMRREYRVSPRVGNPQVVCRETIGREGGGTGIFDRELGGQAHYGKVSARVLPAPRGGGLTVAWDIPRQDRAKGVAEAVEQGILDACCSGPSGYPVEDVRVVVTALEDNAGLLTVPGVHMAAQAAVRSALEKAGEVLLEPLMRVDITVPEAFLGATVSLLGSRGAKVERLDERAGQKRLSALAPMRSLFGFATALRSASQGRAGLMMQFLRFDAM